MTVRDLVKMNIDIDVYNDVTDTCLGCFVGPQPLTELGEAEFKDVLSLECEYDGCDLMVKVDGPEGEWQRKLRRAKKFFHAAAGYCSVDDWDKWFAEV